MIKDIIERQITRAKFSLAQTLTEIELLFGTLGNSKYILDKIALSLNQKQYQYIVSGIMRATFFIELVKQPKIETTKFEVRWANRLPQSDPRHATFDECCNAFQSLLAGLADSLEDSFMGFPQDQEKTALWNGFFEMNLLPYELPIDYRQRRVDNQMHCAENLQWLWNDEDARNAIALRKAVTDPYITGQQAKVFKATLINKLKVKTYLTDRVLTGIHKTNREKRWETHPGSVHFAMRSQCLGVERELIQQLCYFKLFPNDIRQRLIANDLLDERNETVCPITLAPLNYNDFVEEMMDPTHGKSSFHVGHLRPLKADPDDVRTGHTAANIAWVSAHGNRIQGSLSLEQTRSMLKDISSRYEALGWKL